MLGQPVLWLSDRLSVSLLGQGGGKRADWRVNRLASWRKGGGADVLPTTRNDSGDDDGEGETPAGVSVDHPLPPMRHRLPRVVVHARLCRNLQHVSAAAFVGQRAFA